MSIAESLRYRANIYRFLAQTYRRELSGDVAEALADSGILDLLEESGYAVDPDNFTDQERLQELAADYTGVFIGPRPRVSPYGSVHHPDDLKKGRLWGDTTVWVKRFMEDHGVTLTGDKYDGIPDHVGHILEFFSMLLDGEAIALEAGDRERAVRLSQSRQLLLQKQLGRWVPAFCKKVEERASSGFYRGVASITAELLAEEQSGLGQVA